MRKIVYMVLIMVVLHHAGSSAQLSRGGKPLDPGWQKSGFEWVVLDTVRTDELLLEDQWAGMTGLKSNRIAKEVPTQLQPSSEGTWKTLAGGTRIWQLGIRGAGARALGLVFDRYFLKPGVRLFVFDPDRGTVMGAYTDLNNKPSAMLPVSYLRGEELVLQLEIPPGMNDFGELRIGSVRMAYQPVFGDKSALDGYFGDADTCEVDVNCLPGTDWQLAKRSVVRMINGELCTGVLVNNTARDGKAYLLTAAHCIFNSAGYDKSGSTVFYFNYESPACDGQDGTDTHTISGATLLATGDKSEIHDDGDSLDFALLELSIAPPDTFLPYYAGWDRSGSISLNTVTLHHPRGDVMKISVDNDQPETDYHTEPYFEDFVYGSFWRIVQWEVGSTEGGSSGGPLFNEDKQVIGTLTGGPGSCANPVNDYYTRFDFDWDHYPDSIRQLKVWLDPAGTGTMTLEGFDPLTGVEDTPSRQGNLVLYPNPAREELTVERIRGMLQPAEIGIYDITGTLLLEQVWEGPDNAVIRTGAFPPGIYLLRVRTRDSLTTGTFIISR